ncbi:ankyrin repeat domain-containing protein [Dysgonomonas sp. ZJ279]|uniref:ankyrin repeat domain-containing protein n=1 Tax=Dysgonomonas sp. ZJ279 TaxID=2709796 RepID=UPI0013E9CC93|nr:ankyrin repeat domain-containing protein [Dysgonomonas sp. ZJ279]
MLNIIIKIIAVTFLLFPATVLAQSNDMTDLFLFIKNNDTKLVMSLNDVNVNIVDKNMYTPLMYAVKNKNLELAKYIIFKGAEINCLKNGYNALIIAAENKDLKMLELLYTNGADLCLVDSTNIVWGGPRTVMNSSIIDGCYCENVFSFLLERGAKIEGTNILSYAIYIRNLKHEKKKELIKDLIAR